MKWSVEVIESRISDLIQYAYAVNSTPKEISFECTYNGRDIRETDFYAKRNDIKFDCSAKEFYEWSEMPLAGWGADDITWTKLIENLNDKKFLDKFKCVIKNWVAYINKRHKRLSAREQKYNLLVEAPLNKKASRKKRNLLI